MSWVCCRAGAAIPHFLCLWLVRLRYSQHILQYTRNTLCALQYNGNILVCLAVHLKYYYVFSQTQSTFCSALEISISIQFQFKHSKAHQIWCALHYSGNVTTSNVKFVSFNARYPMPHGESGSPDSNYYSFDVSGIHVISLSSYIPFEHGSPQYNWLADNLYKCAPSLQPCFTPNAVGVDAR